jgi:hypothetical protein
VRLRGFKGILLVWLSHYLDRDPLFSLTVKFGVINLLPGADIQSSRSYRNYHLMVHQKILEMSISVGLPGAVMTIIDPFGGQLPQPFVDVADQPRLGIVDIDCGGNVRGRNQTEAFLYS